MVALPNTYKPAEVEAATGGSSVPPGKYRFVVLGSQEKDTAKGDGSYVEFHLQVTEGPQKGSDIFDRFNFNNKNPKTVDIAFAQFKGLATACGKPDVTNTDELNNCIGVLTWGPQNNKPQYNEVKKYEKSTATTEGYVAPVATGSTNAQQAAAAASGKPAWA